MAIASLAKPDPFPKLDLRFFLIHMHLSGGPFHSCIATNNSQLYIVLNNNDRDFSLLIMLNKAMLNKAMLSVNEPRPQPLSFECCSVLDAVR